MDALGMPAFYHGPRTFNEMVDYVVRRTLGTFGLDHAMYSRWEGPAVSGRRGSGQRARPSGGTEAESAFRTARYRRSP